MKRLALGSIVVAALMLGACTDGGGDQQAGAVASSAGVLKVFTVNYPLAYFAQRIGSDQVTATYPGPANQDPAFWNPPAEAVLLYQAADLIILNGASYAKWREKVTLPASKLVNTSAGFADRFIAVDDVVTHAHGPGGEHAHAGLAFTTWLDFTQAALQARAIAEAFAAARPAHAEFFRRNLADLERDLMALDAELAAAVADHDDQPLLASHPIYQYLARRFGLTVQSVTWEPDEDPGFRQWEELRRRLEAHPARWMIWEGEPAADSVRRLDEMGVASLVFDPCATVPATGDFMDVMRANVMALSAAFR